MKRLLQANVAVALTGLIALGGVSLASGGAPSFPRDTLSIVRFGAVGGGQVPDTRSIQAAIDACNRQGGGTVLIPRGVWLSGPLVLKSHVDLHLDSGALLQFTRDFSQYHLYAGNWEGLEAARNQSPLYADSAVDLAITGSGVIDGGGDAWRPVRKSKVTPGFWRQLLAKGGVLSADGKTWYPSRGALKGSLMKEPGVLRDGKTVADYLPIKDFLRPNLLVLANCSRVILEGVTFRNSPAWCLHPLLCRDVLVRGIFADNPPYAQNGDGIDIESCSGVIVEDSRFDVGDDGICIKSGRDEEGRRRGRPTENVLVRNCTVFHAHGGFVIGSEMSGGVRRVRVTGCRFIGTDVGLRFKSARGRGGVVEDISVDSIYMKDIVTDAILFDMYYMAVDPVDAAASRSGRATPRPVDEGTPVFRHFTISHIDCDGAARGIFMRGLPEMPIRNVVMEHLRIRSAKGIFCQDTADVMMRDIAWDTGGGAMRRAADTLVVDQHGNGDFRTVQAAINSLPARAGHFRLILIRPGVYREKIFLDRDSLILRGTDPASTVITQSIARDIWRCNHPDDLGAATLNLSGSDLCLENLTIENTFGFEHRGDTVVPCPSDSLGRYKTVHNTGHQMALRSFGTTRLRVVHCTLRAYGGDTVSPWNVAGGLFYFKDCTMEGGVDFYCPRGWAYADSCLFVADDGPACIWHDGSANPDSKSVFRDCTFRGYAGFHLGRYHRDAQFYLVDCTFSRDMADAPIALVPTANTIRWGQRIYFYGCHRTGGDYAWFRDNLDSAPGDPSPDAIDASWVFGGRWNPEGTVY